MRRSRALAVAASLALAGSTADARAQSKGDDQPEFMREPIVATRRHGFTIGITTAPELVSLHGTPTAYADRSAAYELHVGPSLAPMVSGYLGYALADELSFTVALEPSLYRRDDVKISGTSFEFRIEAFPFTHLGGLWPDVGLVGRAGVGSMRVTRESTGELLASSGGNSVVGLDVIWDAGRLGHFGVGPTLGVTYRWSETYAETDVLLGLRVAFYGGKASAK